MIKHFLVSLSVLLIVKLSTAVTINTAFKWNQFEFQFPSPAAEQIARNSGDYVPGNSLPIDVAVFNKQIFVTFPRFGPGVPFSLGVISAQMGTSGYKIEPYPDYPTQSATNCNNGIINSFRVAIDEMNRLWVVDSGSIAGEQICPAKIIVFNLNTRAKIFTYFLADIDYNFRISNLVTPIVVLGDPTPSGTCRPTMLYIADVSGSIIVFDYCLSLTFTVKPTWVAQNKWMFPVPNYSDFYIAGETFNFMDGVLGMAVSPKTDVDRKLYFHALASGTENVCSLSTLNDGASWRANKNAHPTLFNEIGVRGNQSASEVMDKNGNLFFGLMEPISLACWNSKKAYNKANIRILVTNNETLQFLSGMKIVINTQGDEELWFVTNRLQKFMSGTMKSTEVNYRIQNVLIKDLIGGTQC